MKYFFLFFFAATYMPLDALTQVNCQDIIAQYKREISQLKQEASELRRSKESLSRQNGELQTALLICQGKPSSTAPPAELKECPPTYEQENKDLKKQLEKLKEDFREKEELIKETVKVSNQCKDDLKMLAKSNDSINVKLKDCKTDLKTQFENHQILKKEFEDSSKVFIKVKTEKQILFDSIYTSIDFKKEVIHTDIKATGAKDPELGDVLIEIPYSIVKNNNWTTDNLEYKLKRLGTLYLRYRTALKIRVSIPSVETEEEKKNVTSIYSKTIGRINFYTNPTSFNQNPLSIENDFLLNSNEQNKKGVLLISIIKRD
jgi:DNA repair exonuclease SbcCD ATPase subunit